jgi:hypothetical protein
MQCICSPSAQSRVSVNVNGQFTYFIKVLVGVHQGDPLNLLSLACLWRFWSNTDIRQSVGSDWQGKVPDLLGVAVFMLHYAGEVTLIANDPVTLQAQLQAQRACSRLEQYYRDWYI